MHCTRNEMAEQKSRHHSHSVLKGSEVIVDVCCIVCRAVLNTPDTIYKDGKIEEHKGFYVCINEDGKQIEAKNFYGSTPCRECFYSGYGKRRLPRSHHLDYKTTISPKKPSSAAALNSSNEASTKPCQYHHDRIAKYFCNDHEQLGCTACMIINHRTCKVVYHVTDLTQGLLESPEYKQFEKTTECLKTRTVQVLEACKENVTKSELSSSYAVQHILGLQNDMNVLFDSQVDHVKKHAEATKSADLERMKMVNDAGNQILYDTDKIASKFDDLKKTNQLCKLFNHMQKTQDGLKTLEDNLEKAETMNKVTTYIFEASAELKRIIDESVGIGQTHTVSPEEVTTTKISEDPQTII